MAQAPCKTCPDLPTRVEMIKQVSKMIADGHRGIAAMYEAFAKELEGPDREAMRMAAKAHNDMASQTEMVVVPDASPPVAGEEVVG